MAEPNRRGESPLINSSKRERKRVSRSNRPSGVPAVVPISPWLSKTANVSLCLSVSRGRAVPSVAGI